MNTSRVGAAFLSLVVALAAAPLRGADEDPKPQPKPEQTDPGPARPATPPGGALRDPVAWLERMRETVLGLDLTDAQKEKAKAMFEKSIAEVKKSLEDAGAVDRLRAAGQAMRAVRQNLEELLSEEQMGKLREKLLPLGPGGQPMSPGERIAGLLKSGLDQIDLSDEQKKQVENVVAEFQKKAAEAREAALGQADQLREKLEPLVQQAQEQINAALSPEQRQKLQKIREEMRQRLPGGRDTGSSPPKTESSPPKTEDSAPPKEKSEK